MKKVSCVVMDKYREVSLHKLREAGVLHIGKKPVSSGTLSALQARQAQVRKALGLLRRYPVKKTEIASENSTGETESLINKILELGTEKQQLLDQVNLQARVRRNIEKWGDFDPRDFELLESRGIRLIPYEIPLRVYQTLDPNIELIVLSADKRAVKALAFSEIPGIFSLKLPEYSLSELDQHIAEIQSRLDCIETELAGLAVFRSVIEAELKNVQYSIDFETARAGMETLQDVSPETCVSWVSGYVPCDKMDALKQAAASDGWAVASADPASEDKPPTLIRNNAFVRIIQPLLSFLGTVPGYREYDISMSFLVFFCLFFAMIFGDAAYGLILFIASLCGGLAFRKKAQPKGAGQASGFPDAAKLFMLLSACTLAWGAITGSWFAMPVSVLPRFLQALIIAPFNSTGELAAFPPLLQRIFKLPAEIPLNELKTRWNIQFLCFTTGVIQLVWGRGKNIIKQFPSLTALAQLGWLFMMLGLYFLVLFMLLKVPLPGFAIWFIGGGLVLYFIFAEQNGGNFFKNIGRSFANFLSIFLNSVGSFADIISYIRLFAVGLAGSTIAESFNAMALPGGGAGAFSLGFALRIFAAVLILIFGHSLNIVMNCLSVIVHGVRLNLLEYAGNHLGMEWSGYTYKPFANMRQK